eukprot:907670-Amphidinium_carterae.3
MAWVKNEYDREQKRVMTTMCDWRNADVESILRIQKEKDPRMNEIYAAHLKKAWTGDSSDEYKSDVFIKQVSGNSPMSITLMCFRCLGEIEHDPKKYCHKNVNGYSRSLALAMFNILMLYALLASSGGSSCIRLGSACHASNEHLNFVKCVRSCHQSSKLKKASQHSILKNDCGTRHEERKSYSPIELGSAQSPGDR